MRLDEYLAASRSTANEQLRTRVGYGAEDTEGAIDVFVSNGAGCEWQDAMGTPGGETWPAVAIDGEAHVIAVVPGNFTWHCL